MVNRSAIILKYKEPFIEWVNNSDPFNDDPRIAMHDANSDCTVYLIREEDAENLDEWVSLNYKQLFESELEDWYTDESLWPKKRNRLLFNEWFSVECHSMILDTVGNQIVDDEI